MNSIRNLWHKIDALLVKYLGKYRQFVLYCSIGLTGATIDYISFVLMTNWGIFSIPVANFISMSISIINNFILNSYLNFKKTDRLLVRGISFYLVGLFGIFVSTVMISVMVINLGVHKDLAKIISIPFIAVMQFLLNKFISFRK